MTGAAWSFVLLAAALLLAPLGDAHVQRTTGLSASGRLAFAPATPARYRAGRVVRSGSPTSPLTGSAKPVAGPPAASALVVCVAALAAATPAGPVLALTAAVAASSATFVVVSAARRARQSRVDRGLAAAINLAAAELEAGARPAAAFEAAAAATVAHRRPLLLAARASATGGDAAQVLLDATGLASLGHAWRVAELSGAPAAEVMNRVAADVTDRLELAQEVATELAAARSSAGLLAALPVMGILLGTAMDADPLHVLLATPSGRLLCLAGVALDAAGLLWTHRLTVHAAQPPGR